MTTRPDAAIGRLVDGYYNSRAFHSVENAGGLDESDDGLVAGHVINFPAALEDLGAVSAYVGAVVADGERHATSAGAAKDIVLLAVAAANAANDLALAYRDAAKGYRDQAQAAAAGVNLPAIAMGDAGKALVVNPAGTGYVTGQAGLPAATGAEAATGTSTTKAVTPAALAGWLPNLTELTSLNIDREADRIPLYDASGAVVRWVRPSSLGSGRFAGVASKTAAYTVTTADAGLLILASGTWTLGLPAAASAGNGFSILLKNTSSGTITVDPAGSETINGSATVAITRGASAILVCDGTGWQAIGIPATDGSWTWDPAQIGTGLTLSSANTVVSTTSYGSVLGNTEIAGLKYYELTALDSGTGQRIAGVCVAGASLTNTAFVGNARGYGYNSNGTKANNGSGTAFGSTYTSGDVLGFAVNTYTLGVWPRKNGVWQGGGDPVTGANPMFTLLPGVYYPAGYMDGTSGAQSWRINSGLIFAPPSGFTPL
ncbi:hypothetical protein J2847_005083 [Azospirillum agricola]|uniref:hypothetical protein n=1 Tax=Azospirillum agricola TaxID=1720247 RepID=UPI001AE351A5|nr:hypothetical protein [Azospirillum agricola]MBP2231764.1 hypothetical protein [Azospirillum agricola]